MIAESGISPESSNPQPVTALGVSIIVCCHNSQALLPQTLEHLKRQITEGIAWEVVLVDNVSSDDTHRTARKIWEKNPIDIPLRIVTEPKLGLAFARQRGIREATYEFLSFVDDDNWISPNWVQTVFDTMIRNPRVGACGGLSRAEFESSQPKWFSDHAYLYAVMPDCEFTGDVTDKRTLWGAGLTVRRSALADLEKSGYRSLLVGRTGEELLSGEDTELCLAFRLAGWQIWLEPTIHFVHYIPSRRLTWSYLRRLAFGSAMATAAHDAYFNTFKPPRKGPALLVRRFRQLWAYQVLYALLKLLRNPYLLLTSAQTRREGLAEIIQLEMYKGRLLGLLKARSWYNRRCREIDALGIVLSSRPQSPAQSPIQCSRPTGQPA